MNTPRTRSADQAQQIPTAADDIARLATKAVVYEKPACLCRPVGSTDADCVVVIVGNCEKSGQVRGDTSRYTL